MYNIIIDMDNSRRNRLMWIKFFFAAGAAPEETNQRSSSAHNRHSLTKGKFDIECNELHLGHSRLLKARSYI